MTVGRSYFLGIHFAWLTGGTRWTVIEARTLSAVYWLIIGLAFVSSGSSPTGWWNYLLIGLISSCVAFLAPKPGAP